MAASLIQSFWRQYHAQRKNECNKTENHQFIEALRQKHEAATVIQVGLWYFLYLFCKFSNKKIFLILCTCHLLFLFIILLTVS